MQTLYPALRLLSVALAATAASTAFAQVKPAVSDETIALEKFIVQSVAAPTANTLADKQQIALQPAAASVINVIKYLPGVSLSQGDAIGGDDWSTRINIRGFTEAQLGFSVDGITTGYTSYGGGAKPNRYIDIENVASVVVSQGAAEIGAASTQALGGTLAYFTDKPADQFGVLAKYTGGSFVYPPNKYLQPSTSPSVTSHAHTCPLRLVPQFHQRRAHAALRLRCHLQPTVPVASNARAAQHMTLHTCNAASTASDLRSAAKTEWGGSPTPAPPPGRGNRCPLVGS